MMHRKLSAVSTLFVVLALGACRDTGDGATTGTTGTTTATTTTTTGTTGPGTTTGAPTTGTTTEAPTTGPGPTTTTGPGTTGTETTGGVESTQIRVVHLSPDAPTVDIFADGQGTAPVFDGLAPRSADSVSIPAGDYAFAIAPDGSPADQAVFQVPAQSYEAGKSYTLVALGKLADQSFDVLRLEDELTGIDPTKVRLQVTHAAAAAKFADVDVWSGPALDMLSLLLDDFPFKATRRVDVADVDQVLAVDLDEDQNPDIVWEVPGVALTPALGGLIHVFAYNDAEERPSLQVVAVDGPTSQLDPKK